MIATKAPAVSSCHSFPRVPVISASSFVIGAWLLLVVALSVAVPPLMKLASDRNQELLPANSAVMAATRDMTTAFHEPGIQNIALVVLTDETGLTKADEDVYRTLVAGDLLRAPDLPEPAHQFRVTGDPAEFERLGRRFLGPEIGRVEVLACD